MSNDKKISAKEAGIAVLKKFEQLLVKAEKEGKHIGWAKLHSKLEREGYSKESADKIDGAIKAKMGKSDMKKDLEDSSSDDMNPGSNMDKSDEPKNPDEKADADLGEKVENDVEQHMQENKAAEEQESHKIIENDHVKGHIKLAKFMGHIEGKRSSKVMPDSGNNDPTMPVDKVGPAANPPKKLN